MKGDSGEKGSHLTRESASERTSQSSSESSSEWEQSERGAGRSEDVGERRASAEVGVGVQSWLRKAAALWESLRLYGY